MRSPLILALLIAFSSHAFAAPQPDRTWKAKCANCHGEKGDPKGKPQGEKMKVANLIGTRASDAALETAIKTGIKREKDGVKQEMKAFDKELPAEDIKALVTFIRTFK